MNTCPITTLKLHSAGDSYTPTLKANNRWQLVSVSGAVLVGFRGNPYNFQNEKNAQNWLCSNLSRFKNAEETTATSHVVKLHKIYAEEQSAEVMAELQAIAEYEQGLWQVVECSSNAELGDIDGGNAFTEI